VQNFISLNLKEKSMRYAFFFPNCKQYNLKSPVKNLSMLHWMERFMCGVKGLSTTNIDDYGMLTTHNQMPHFLSQDTSTE